MNRLRYRAHSWAADRFRGIQYPREQRTERAKHPLPLLARFSLAMALIVVLTVLLGILVAMLAFAWGVVGALFS